MEFLMLALYFIAFVYFLPLIHFINGAVVQVSNPFDPYRLECPHKFAIIKLTLQRVESTGKARNDTLIASFCENIAKLYPSERDDISPADDEDCRWTPPVEIPGPNFGFNEICNRREFIAGISRQEMLQYGFLCCKVKDRKRKKCFANRYTLPTTDAPELAVERNQLLLSSLAYQDDHLIAQFCDYAVMNQDEIDQEIIKESKSKLSAWFAAQNSNSRPPIVQGQQVVIVPTQLPQINGQNTLLPDDFDNGDNNVLPKLIPREKNEFVATTARTRPTTKFTVPTIGLKVIKPKSPIRYTLSPEELAAFPGSRATADPSVDDNELDSEDRPTTPLHLSVLRQRASLGAILRKTSTKVFRNLFYTSTPSSTTTTTATTTIELDDTNEQLGLESTTPPSDLIQQRVSLANFLNKIVTTQPTTKPRPPTTTSTPSTTLELDDSNNDVDDESTPPVLLPVLQQRVSLVNFLNKIITTPPPTRATTTVPTTTASTTIELDDSNDLEPTPPLQLPVLQQRVSLSNFLNKIITTKPSTRAQTVATTLSTTTFEDVTDSEDLVTEADEVDKQRISLVSFLHKVPTQKGLVLSTPTPTTTTAKTVSPTTTTAKTVSPTTIETDSDNENEFAEDIITPDPVERRRFSLKALLNKIIPSTKLPTIYKTKSTTEDPLGKGFTSNLLVNAEEASTSNFVSALPKKTKRPKAHSTTIPVEQAVELEIGEPTEAVVESSQEELEDSEHTTESTKKPKRVTNAHGKGTSTKATRKPSRKRPTSPAITEELETEAQEITEATTESTTKTSSFIKVKNGRGHNNFLNRQNGKSKTTKPITVITTTTESSPDVIEISLEEAEAWFGTTKDSKFNSQLGSVRQIAAGKGLKKETDEITTESAKTISKPEDLPDPPAVIIIPTDYDLSSESIPLQNKLLVKAVSTARRRIDETTDTEQGEEVIIEEDDTSTLSVVTDSIGEELTEFTLPTFIGSTVAGITPLIINSLTATEESGSSLENKNARTFKVPPEFIPTPKAPKRIKQISHKNSTNIPSPGQNPEVIPNTVDGRNESQLSKNDEYYYYYVYEGSETDISSSFTESLTTEKSFTKETLIENEVKILCNTTLAATAQTSGLVIACGDGNNVWFPPRCPIHTFCMESSDTTFRICCPALFVS